MHALKRWSIPVIVVWLLIASVAPAIAQDFDQDNADNDQDIVDVDQDDNDDDQEIDDDIVPDDLTADDLAFLDEDVLRDIVGDYDEPTRPELELDEGSLNTTLPDPMGVPGTTCVGTGNDQAIACYQDSDDKLWVYDAQKDGYSAVVFWRVEYHDGRVREGICRNVHGFDSWASCDKEFAEDEYITIVAYGVDGDDSESGPRVGPATDRVAAAT